MGINRDNIKQRTQKVDSSSGVYIKKEVKFKGVSVNLLEKISFTLTRLARYDKGE